MLRDAGSTHLSRRNVLAAAGGAALGAIVSPGAAAQGRGPFEAGDRVFICNEDSNTMSVLDPRSNTATAINLTSFDEDHRAPFRFATGGVVPTHSDMIHKPLYHGAISLHGAAPSPDSRLLACTGRGSSNLYLIDTATLKPLGGRPNPNARPDTNPDMLTSGVLVGREPHEPTFTRNGSEIWSAIRGEQAIAVVDVAKAKHESAGGAAGAAVRRRIETVPGPAMVWFTADGSRAFVVSQKVPMIDVFDVDYDADGFSRSRRRTIIDVGDRDRFGFTPFLRLAPDGSEFWLTHKLADAVSVLDPVAMRVVDTIALGGSARPNHIEFVDRGGMRLAYVTCARVDDNGPRGAPSSRIAVIDRSSRRVVGDFFSHGREAHGIWADPAATQLYVAHELDELPSAEHAGQTVVAVFDIREPMSPRPVARVPLGDLPLPSGRLRNKKSINLVFVRPGAPSATA